MSKNLTKLSNRNLWFDGDSTYDSNEIVKILLSQFNKEEKITNFKVEEIDEDLKKCIEFSDELSFDLKYELNEDKLLDSFNWNIPEEFKTIDVYDIIDELFKKKVESEELTENEKNDRYNRIQSEIQEFKSRDLTELLQTLVYVIHKMKKNAIIWSGRGSSCASYVLFLLGLHDVDSVKYDLPMSDFFR